MAFRSNFDGVAQIVRIAADSEPVVRPSGAGGVVPDMRLLTRHVTLQQPVTDHRNVPRVVVHGACDLGDTWTVLESLDASELVPGEALAVGVETYLSENPHATSPLQPTSSVTVTWAQVITLEQT